METFAACFSAMEDPRARNARHDLLELVFVALAAVLCGAEDCTDMAAFARAKLDFLRQVVKLEHGPPSHDTFSRVFRRLAPEPFEAAFAQFTAAFAGALKGVVAIDGKALRGAYERGCRASPLHLVNVWAAEARLVIGQRLAPGRNEVLGAQQALALLSLKGCIVTADALHCQRDHASYLHQRGAGFVFTVKHNQPGLFAALDALPWTDTPVAHRQTDRGHGRITTRTIQTLPAPPDLPFPHVDQVWLIERYVTDLTGTPTSAIAALGVTNLHTTQAAPADIARLVRDHWGVESLHWLRDTVYREDHSRARTRSGPRVMAGLRNLAVGAHHLAGRRDITEASREAGRVMHRPFKILNLA